MDREKIRFLKMASIFTFFILVVLVSLCVSYEKSWENMYSQQAAPRWKGENTYDFVQNTVFFSADNQITKNDIERNIEDIQGRLKQELGVAKEGSNIFAYSGKTQITAASEHNSIKLNAIGVGADYFFFHPLELVTGKYIDKNDLANNIAILDENAAQELFGSSDIIGKQIDINEENFTVVGVVRENSNVIDSELKYEKGCIYLEFGKAQRLLNMKAGCLETVLPKIPEGYSIQLLGQKYSEQDNLIVTNTYRFTMYSIFKKMIEPEKLLIQNKAIYLSNDENIARVLEFKLIGQLRIILLIFILFLLQTTVLIVNIVKIYRKSNSKELVRNVRNYYKRYYKNLRQKCRSDKKIES